MENETRTRKKLQEEVERLRKRVSELEALAREDRRSEEALRESEARYRGLFEHSPISLWLKDFSEVKKYIDSLRESGVKDFRGFFEGHPEAVGRCAALVRILDVNQATLKLYRARSKQELYSGLPQVFVRESYGVFREQLIALTEGQTVCEFESPMQTMTGQRNYVALRLSLAPGAEETWARVFVSVTDLTQRRKTEEALLTHQELLRSLASELWRAEESERRRVAAYLHDRVGQNLSVAHLKVRTLEASLPAPQFRGTLANIRALLERVIKETRSLTVELSPPVLSELGFEAGVEWLAEKVQAEHGLKVRVRDDRQPKPLEEELRGVLFRAVGELLHNVVKHAQATEVEVSLEREQDQIRLTVTDNGVGFDTRRLYPRVDRTEGFGLFSLREQLAFRGGRFEIQSTPGRGTRAVLTAPLGPVG